MVLKSGEVVVKNCHEENYADLSEKQVRSHQEDI